MQTTLKGNSPSDRDPTRMWTSRLRGSVFSRYFNGGPHRDGDRKPRGNLGDQLVDPGMDLLARRASMGGYGFFRFF
jgi:hypothetical protein